MDALISVATIYILIVIGFVFKRSFKDQVNEKSFVLLNLYFLQPILIFWGLTRAPINDEFIISPLIYAVAVFITLFFAFFYSRKVFKDYQDRSIFLASSLVGNTGNLGIPLGIALFGEASVPYTSILNIANMFYIYIFSVYFFAGEKFKFTDALKEIFKIPAIHAAILAILFNYYGFSLNANFEKVFTMGAYAAIVMQLVVFGIFMSQVKVKSANWNLSINITLFKHIILPIIGLFVIVYFKIDPFVGAIIFLELIVPLAVNNVNLSALYNCKPIDTTFAVIISTLSFIGFMAVYIIVIDKFFGV
ncbi:permease [Arcobacter sp. CECT 8989]|nr:permease [Arcobacter sp. CECT 8989]